MNILSKRGLSLASGASARVFSIAAFGHTAAFAQGAPDAAAEEGEREIIVTGSRLVRNSFNSPTPVNVVGAERMQDLNITSVGDGLNQIPSFRPLTTPSTNSFRTSANIAARTLDLRGLGTDRVAASRERGFRLHPLAGPQCGFKQAMQHRQVVAVLRRLVAPTGHLLALGELREDDDLFFWVLLGQQID